MIKTLLVVGLISILIGIISNENFILPDAHAVLYENSEFGFTIAYPPNWDVNDSVETLEGVMAVVKFTPDPNSIVGMDVNLLETNPNNFEKKDQDYLNMLIDTYDAACNDASFDAGGFLCSNFDLKTSDYYQNDPYTSYFIHYTFTVQLLDGSSLEAGRFVYEIPRSDLTWRVISQGEIDELDLYGEDIVASMNSLTVILEIPEEPEPVAEYEHEVVAEPGPEPTSTSDKISGLEIPEYVKNIATFWKDGQIDDQTFVGAIQYMVQTDIITVPDLPPSEKSESKESVPSWLKTTVGFWADGQTSDAEFANSIQWLVSNGIITLN